MLSKIFKNLQSEKSQKILYIITLLVVFGVIFSITLFPLEDVDAWTHLKYGELIVENHKLPQSDIFSYTVAGTPDVDHEWLAQIIIYSVYKYVGFDGLVIFKAIIALIVFVILLRTYNSLYGRSLFSLVLLMGAAMTAAFRFIIRPDIFTFILLAILINVVCTYRQSKNNWKIYLLPLIFLIWVNTHGAFIIGWGLLGLYTGVQIIFYILRTKSKFLEKYALSFKKLRLLIIFSILSVLICLVNPYGYEMILVPFKGIFGLSEFFSQLNEWKSPFDPLHQPKEYVTLFVASGALTLVLFLLNYRSFDLLYFLIFLLFAYSNFKGMRNIALYGIGIFIPLAYNLKIFIKSFNATDFQKKYLKPLLNISLIIFLLLLYLQFVFKGNNLGLNHHDFGTGTQESNFPGKLVDFIDEVGIQGNMMNQYGLGSYLIWKCYPERKVFLDGRSGLYGEKFFFRYKSFAYDAQEFAKATEEYDFNYTISQHSKFLSTDSNWRLLYFDNLFELYVRNNEQNKKVIEKYGYRYVDPNKTLNEIFANYSEETALEYEKEIKKTLARNYQVTIAHVLLSELYKKEGKIEDSLKQLQISQELNPNMSSSYLALGNHYAGVGDNEQAITNFKKAISLDSSIPEAHHNLANIYTGLGQYDDAIKEYQKAIYISNDYALSYLGLGVIYADYLKEPAKAIIALQEYLILDPNSDQKENVESKIKQLREGIYAP